MFDRDDVERSLKTVETGAPFERFGRWLAEAEEKEPNDPNAMALATATSGAAPSVRMVLLKEWDEAGFVFYTNFESRKADELTANDQAALLFHWKSLRRQVRIDGRVTPVDAATADAYFASRPRDAQIGAWASDQSRPLAGRFELEKRVAKYAAKHAVGPVPRPPHWSGFRLAPHAIEFWISHRFRLHKRELYERADAGWTVQELFP